MRVGGWIGLWLLCAFACGGEEGDGGGAAGGASPGMLGHRCLANTCATGLTCGRDFAVAGLCTANCTNDQSCSLVAPMSNARCIVTSTGLCMLPCTGDAQCPSGTTCGMAGGQMVCRAP